MKRFVLLTLVFAMLLSMVACFDMSEETTKASTTDSGTTASTTASSTTSSTTTSTTDNSQNPPPSDDIIGAVEVYGVNEAINLCFTTNENYTYNVYYKLKDADDYDYVQLEDELMIADGNALNCYILGITAGTYKVKIEALGKVTEDIFWITLTNIVVSAQDRSGYAHFGASEGVGAYNNDGTLKEGTKVIYVTNENKNTVTCEIGGTTYTGLVNILQAQYKSDTPMLVRIIGKITTNQWNEKNVEPRLADNSNATDDFFENTFSTEYGENLANLIVKMKGNGGGAKTYNYRTTPEGLTDVRETNGGTKTVNYKGSDFPSMKGMLVYDDDSYYNMLEVKGSKNITVEGVGEGAEIFQFGIGFEECSNIEIKNLTFTDYPEDALNFLGGDRADLAQHSRYWVHNCTFNRGYNAWDISGERDKYAGDGSIDFNNVSGLTLAYNFFNNSKKSMLFGSGDSCACMNMTMHHNYFYKVESRLPLGRHVNLHTYNNYYDGCGNCADLRAGSYIFSENNYFESTSKPFGLSSSYAKSYGDIFISSGTPNAKIVTDRTQAVSSICKPDGSTDMSNFDTNSTLFYYDSANKCSDVSIMISAEDVPEFVAKHSGAGKFESLNIE